MAHNLIVNYGQKQTIINQVFFDRWIFIQQEKHNCKKLQNFMILFQAIPSNDTYYDYYQFNYLLHFLIKQNVENRNKVEELNEIVSTVYDYFSYIENYSEIHFHDVPFSFYPDMEMRMKIKSKWIRSYFE